MTRGTPRSTRTATRLPDTTLFRSGVPGPAPRLSEGVRHQLGDPDRSRDLGPPLPGCGGEGGPVHSEREQHRNGGGADRQLGLQRSEEHTSELQSLMRISYAVFCLKKKNINTCLVPHEPSHTI